MQYPSLYPPSWAYIPGYRPYVSLLLFVGLCVSRGLRLALNALCRLSLHLVESSYD